MRQLTFALCALLILAVDVRAQEEPRLLPYESPKKSFYLFYPAAWKVDIFSEEEDMVRFTDQESGAYIEISASSDKAPVPCEEKAQELIKLAEVGLKDFNLLSESVEKIRRGIEAAVLVYTDLTPAGPEKHKVYVYYQAAMRYVLHYGAPVEYFDAHLALADQLMRRLVPQAPGSQPPQ
jgi:hypothetical protein